MTEVRYSETPEGKAQAERMFKCRLKKGCASAKDFFEKFSNGNFSYPQYQKYESGERPLSFKAAMMYADLFGVNWEWLKDGKGDTAEEKNCSNSDNNILSDKTENLLIKIIKQVEDFGEKNKGAFSAEQKARLINFLYQELSREKYDDVRKIIDLLLRTLVFTKEIWS